MAHKWGHLMEIERDENLVLRWEYVLVALMESQRESKSVRSRESLLEISRGLLKEHKTVASLVLL